MMKNNLINPISPKQQYAIRFWFITSILLISITIVTLIVIEIPQLYALQSIQKDTKMFTDRTKQFDKIMAIKHKLKQREQQLQKQQKMITHCNTQFACLIDIFSHIIDKCKSHYLIESLQINNNNFALTAYCAQPHQATNLVKQLSQLKQYKHVSLTSLQQTDHKAKLLLTVQGK